MNIFFYRIVTLGLKKHIATRVGDLLELTALPERVTERTSREYRKSLAATVLTGESSLTPIPLMSGEQPSLSNSAQD